MSDLPSGCPQQSPRDLPAISSLASPPICPPISLAQVATLEQNMATGEDSSGKAFKGALPELRALLEKPDLLLSPEDKMRLLMIYVITQEGIRQDERRQLNQLAGISPEDQVRRHPAPSASRLT